MKDFYGFIPKARECAENEENYPEEMNQDNYVSEDFVGHEPEMFLPDIEIKVPISFN